MLENIFSKIIANLEQLQDNFFQIDALSKKTLDAFSFYFSF